MDASPPLAMTKHHGAGNDFLVYLDAAGDRPLTGAEARALCDRRRGIGADGVLRARRRGDDDAAGAAVVMELLNADGSAAEMSGNGIRCLVQAVVAAGWVGPGPVEVDTGAGRRQVRYRPGPGPGQGYAQVDMGSVGLGAELVLDEPAGVLAARAVDTGNPHLVLLMGGPVADDVVAEAGARLSRSVRGHANVEFVWATAEPGVLAMRVYERGVGETLACGTGTCAVAAAARAWGLVGPEVRVRNPGGTLEVEVAEEGRLVLGGPVVLVARVEVEAEVLALMAAEVDGGPRAPAPPDRRRTGAGAPPTVEHGAGHEVTAAR
jgi:diaminopimelate epimerase